MNKIIIGITVLTSGLVFAQEPATAPEAGASTPISASGAESINKDVTTHISAKEMMEQVFADYAKERGISYGVPNARGTTYFHGSASVKANGNSASFVKSRTMAYETAYQDAVAKLVMDLTGQEMIKSVRELFDDESDDRLEAPATLAETETGIMKKIQVLTEAKLDQGLTKLGIDPAKYTATSPEAKKQLYKDSLFKSSVRKAFYAASGFLPVQTFETRTENGRFTVGVVIRSDADCTEIAKCLKLKQRPLIIRENGLRIEEALPTDEELLTQFGVRLYFDETGYPSLLSFGQWGSAYTGDNERRRERAMESAMSQAEAIANEQLTAFINSKIAVYEATERGEIEEESLRFKNDGSTTEEDFMKIIDRVAKSSTVTGSDSMIGRSTVLKKTLKHPSGQNICMVVRRWSFSQLESARAIINGKAPAPVKKTSEPVKTGDRGVRQGRTYDF